MVICIFRITGEFEKDFSKGLKSLSECVSVLFVKHRQERFKTPCSMFNEMTDIGLRFVCKGKPYDPPVSRIIYTLRKPLFYKTV